MKIFNKKSKNKKNYKTKLMRNFMKIKKIIYKKKNQLKKKRKQKIKKNLKN